jgi:hypothetical protein
MNEVLQNPENAAILTLGLNAITQLLKTKVFPAVDARYINAGVSFLGATAFLVLNGVLGEALVKEGLAVAVMLYASSTGLYKLNKKPKKS